jgi:hypothetical protein
VTIWQATPREIVEALRNLGWEVDLVSPPEPPRGWHCTVRRGDIAIMVAGVTQLSCLWSAVLELIKLIPRK